MSRAPIELELPDGTRVRGIRVGGGERGLVLALHDLGSDLDEFGPLPEVLAGAGHQVVLLDLPGHGLSDGEPPEGSDALELVRTLVELLSPSGSPALIASGRTASVGAVIGASDGVGVQVLIDPRLDRGIVEAGRRTYASRLVLHAAGERLVGSELQRFLRLLIGERLMIHHHAVADGVSAAVGDPTVMSHLALFLQRYQTAGGQQHRIVQLPGGESHDRGR